MVHRNGSNKQQGADEKQGRRDGVGRGAVTSKVLVLRLQHLEDRRYLLLGLYQQRLQIHQDRLICEPEDMVRLSLGQP